MAEARFDTPPPVQRIVVLTMTEDEASSLLYLLRDKPMLRSIQEALEGLLG